MCLLLPVLHQWPQTLQAEGGFTPPSLPTHWAALQLQSLGTSTDPAALSPAWGQNRNLNHAQAVLVS